MNCKIGIALILIAFFSCQNKQQTATVAALPDTTKTETISVANEPEGHEPIDVEDAGQWFIEVAESHLNDGGYPMEDICTPEYFAYKSDAIGVGYDGGLDEESFRKKWSGTYDVKYAGQGTAFLVSGQDNGKVKVTQCKPKTDGSKGFVLLHVVISDPDMKATYTRDVKVVAAGKAYLIDDIIEYN